MGRGVAASEGWVDLVNVVESMFKKRGVRANVCPFMAWVLLNVI